jgi:hypothetical protein
MPFPDVNSFTPVQPPDQSYNNSLNAWEVPGPIYPPTASKAAEQEAGAKLFGIVPGWLRGNAGYYYSSLDDTTIPPA